jgi:two-component system sensor histidine kinase PrrB
VSLATRTGLAAFAAATLTLIIIIVVFQVVFVRVLFDRVDSELRLRAVNAERIAAASPRLAPAELSAVMPGTRVALPNGRIVAFGQLPDGPLPDRLEPGWDTVTIDGARWRLHTVEVEDIEIRLRDGARQVTVDAQVQFAAPLGNVENATQTIRRRGMAYGLGAAALAGLIGYVFGAVASRPIRALRQDTDLLDNARPDQWRIGDNYGSVEVDDVARTLNTSLQRLAEETKRRGAALESARSFASTASHEVRVPLQGALTNLNLAVDHRLSDGERSQVIGRATEQLQRVAAALTAVRSLAEAEFADPSWFEPVDLLDLADQVVADESRRGSAEIEVVSPAARANGGSNGSSPGAAPGSLHHVWADGARLALANVVRNALVHGQPVDGGRGRVVVTVEGPVLSVDDNGPGIPPEYRNHVVERFVRNAAANGSGLGLAIAHQVAVAHGGSLSIDRSPLGGARVTISLAPTGARAVAPPPTADARVR